MSDLMNCYDCGSVMLLGSFLPCPDEVEPFFTHCSGDCCTVHGPQRQTEVEAIAAYNAAATAIEDARWRPYPEEVPAQGEDDPSVYLVTQKHPLVPGLLVRAAKWDKVDGDWDGPLPVIAWRPMPTPYNPPVVL